MQSTLRLILMSSLVPLGFASAEARGASDLQSALSSHLDAIRADLVDVRRDLHRHPEVSGKEERTAGVIATRLEKLGLEVRRDVGGHGVVAILQGGLDGPTVAYRADIDAVPSNAPDPVEFRSVNEGVRHICGHDIHTAIGLGLAEGLHAIREQLPGTVVFVFQPAEESATGAEAMLADDVFGEKSPVAIYAVHTAPMEVGSLATREGVMMSRRDRVAVRFTGPGDLEAAAKHVFGQLNAASSITSAQSFAPQLNDFYLFQLGGPRKNPEGEWIVSGQATTSGPKASTDAEEAVSNVVAGLDHSKVEAVVEYQAGAIAGVTNDPELTKRAVASASRVVGADQVAALTTLIPAFSEDFGSFQRQVPGVMFFLGVSNSDKGIVGMPHSPQYVADEEAIFVGAKAMAAVILDRLQQQ